MAPTVAHGDFNISNSNYQPCHDHAEFEIPANNNRFNHESTVHMLHPHNTQSTFVPWIHNNLYNTMQFHSPSVDTQSPRYWISFHMMPIKLFSRVLRTIKFHHILVLSLASTCLIAENNVKSYTGSDKWCSTSYSQNMIANQPKREQERHVTHWLLLE